MVWWVTVPSPMSGSHREGALREQAAGVEVEVGLGVGRHHARA